MAVAQLAQVLLRNGVRSLFVSLFFCFSDHRQSSTTWSCYPLREASFLVRFEIRLLDLLTDKNSDDETR